MTNEVLFVIAVIAAAFAVWIFVLKHQLNVALAREAEEAKARSDIKAPVHSLRRSGPFIQVASGSILVTSDRRGGLVVAPVPEVSLLSSRCPPLEPAEN
jgi:hypothetical protein